jgi:tRNA pseudouridine13 synthase
MTLLPPGRIRTRLEDFVVEELPAYRPSGEGGHLFVRFTKRAMTTADAVAAIARALACNPRAAGYAGMKDKWAVTTQTVSLEAPRGGAAAELAHKAKSLSLDGIVVDDATPHGHKLKPGHLAGNRFAIAVRDVPANRVDEVTASLENVRRSGLPNAFGPQRFGRHGQNVARTLAWVTGKERAPRDPRLQRLLWSSLQSAVFNRVLEKRVQDGTWTTPLEGDLLKLRASGGLFVCTDVQTDRKRAQEGHEWEVSPTGPMVGARMQWPGGDVLDLERRVVAEFFGNGFDFGGTRRLGAGSRRTLRLSVGELTWRVERDDGGPSEGLEGPAGPKDSDDSSEKGNARACVWVYFVLPKGAYATTVLAAAVALEDKPPQGAGLDAPDETQEEDEGA